MGRTGRSLRSLVRFRPRIVTLVVFLAAVAIIALANLSYDEALVGDGSITHRSYGWPLIWHRIVLHGSKMVAQSTIGWYYSAPRLLTNLAIWLLLSSALAGACEGVLRRYRPRPRWSLRALLVFVGLVAVLCGWYTKARNRAAIQDPLVALRGGYGIPLVYVERSGPKWLDLIGVDRLRRRIVFAHYWSLRASEPSDEQRFLQLARLPDVRYLTGFDVDEFTPTTAKALGGMRQLHTLQFRLDRLTPDLPVALSELRQLRKLSISVEYDHPADDAYARLSNECLAAIGNMTHLESLRLSNLPLYGKSLACLADLKELKSLDVGFSNGEWKGSSLNKPIPQDCLRAIATLTQLEWIRLQHLKIGNESLACLDGLTNLKTLILYRLVMDDRPMLAHLPPLGRLEAIDLSESDVDDDDLRRLAVLPRLKMLSLARPLVTPAGLAALAAIESLEEVELEGDIESPQGIEALVVVQRLNKLYLGGNPSTAGDDRGKLTLDDGKELPVEDLEGFRRALQKLRQSKPGIVIQKYGPPVFWKPPGGEMPDLGEYPFPIRPSTWLPGGDTASMTPLLRAVFEKEGGRVSFYGATWRSHDGAGLITVEF